MLRRCTGRGTLDDPGAAAGLKLDQVERFTEDERVWLDTYRALDPEQRETVLKVAVVMRRPSTRKRGG